MILHLVKSESLLPYYIVSGTPYNNIWFKKYPMGVVSIKEGGFEGWVNTQMYISQIDYF